MADDKRGFKSTAGSIADRLVGWLVSMSFWRLLLFTVVVAELMTLTAHISTGFLWREGVTPGLLLDDLLDELVVSTLAASALIILVKRLKSAELVAARESAYLDSILRSSADLAIAAVGLDYRLTIYNPAAEALFGRRAEDVIGRDMRQVCTGPGGMAEKFEAAMNACAGGGEQTLLLELGEGSDVRLVESRLSSIKGADGSLSGYVIMSRDVTEKLRSDAALMESEAKFRTLVEHSLIGVAIIQDGRYAYVNPRHAEMLGYTQDEMTSLPNVLDRVHPEDRGLVEENIRKRTVGEVAEIRYRFRFLRKDGGTVHVEVHGSRAEYGGRPAVISSVLDITERIKAEEEIKALNEGLERRVAERTAKLEESEHSYRTLAENLPGIVYRVFLREGNRMQFFNDMVGPMTGYAPEELLAGRVCSVDALILAEDRDEVMRRIHDPVREGTPYMVEYRIMHKDGTVRHLQERGRPVRGADGEPMYIDGVILDITGLKTAQQQKDAALERLGESQKMEAIGNLAGGIAHDFNSLLTVMTGDCEMAMGLLDKVHPARPCVELMGQAAAKASELTRKLLIFSQRKRLERMPTDLNKTVTEIISMLKRLIGGRIRVEVALSPGLWKVNADRSGIEQVVMNLALNARDAMPEGGVLDIRTENVKLDAAACKALEGCSMPGRYVRLSVRDTGPGIDDKTIKRIFEPFFTTKPKGRGTGLGLSVVYGIVKESGGWINVNTAPDEGARFDVYMEAVELESQEGGTAG